MIFIDLETTGLNPDTEEILQIGILSEDGKVLMNQYLKPKRKKSWSAAERIHGISPKDVENCPSLDDITNEVMEICKGQEVIIYNAGFDVGFLQNEVRWVIGNIKCAMLEFAELYREWDDYRNSYRWQKLRLAASYVGHVWGQDNEHDAISDCRATKSVWEYIQKERTKEIQIKGMMITEEAGVYEVKHIGVHDEIECMLNDKSTSDWLKWAIRSSLHRNSKDAMRDIKTLYSLTKNSFQQND